MKVILFVQRKDEIDQKIILVEIGFQECET